MFIYIPEVNVTDMETWYCFRRRFCPHMVLGLLIIWVVYAISYCFYVLQDDDSDLECDLEAFPDVSNEAATEATACVKVITFLKTAFTTLNLICLLSPM